jgi:hypothetical protein
MRSINLGIRIKQDTILTVTLPAADGDVVVQIARGDSTQFQRLASQDGLRFQIPLTQGDYVLVVDSTYPPSADNPVTIGTDQDVAFWSAAHPVPQSGLRGWASGIGRAITNFDPKDPWPQPPLAAVPGDVDLDGFLTSNSPITGTMRQLLDAFTGKGPVSPGAAPVTRALLIGIDRYNDGGGQDGAIYKDLHGCVHDVLEVEKLLRRQIPDVRITRLIAPRPDGPGNDLATPPDRIPTYANIVAAWKQVIDDARPNDIVYIHYSGHGGRARTRFPDYKPRGIDESLAPCDINDRKHGRYLRDVEIATLLQCMAQRELLTTLVLDSCHSGDATRTNEAQARRGVCNDMEPRSSDALNSEVATMDELNAVASQLAQSPFGPDATWRIDPSLGRATSYNTVIAACRGHEAAYEYAPEGTVRCGALTYFWLKALAERSPATTYRRVYDQVYGNVHNVFASQSPLILGEQDRLVLGTGIMKQRPSVPVVRVAQDEITLRAGAAMQIEAGMRLAIVPPGQMPELVDLARMAEVEVTRVVDGATSLARRVPRERSEGQIEPPIEIAIGAQGIIRSYPLRMQRAVRLCLEESVPVEAFERLAATIAHDTRRLLVVAGTEGADYQVFINDGRYQICDKAGATLPHVPALPIASDNAAGKVVDQLVHLTRYSNALGLANSDPSAPLTGKLEIELLDLPGYAPGTPGPLRPVPLPPGPARFQHDMYFCLRVRNGSQQHLQVAIIDLQPNWAIGTLVPDAPQLSPGETRDIALHAMLTDPGCATGREVLKVLGTVDHVDPGLLTLPALGQAYLRKSPRAHESVLDKLFRILEDPLTEQRQVGFPRTPSSGWTVAQTELEIYRQPAALVAAGG